MNIQNTPPLGWPHTEAEKYASQETYEVAGPPESFMATDTRKGCGHGCAKTFLFLMVMLAMLGVMAAAAIVLLFPGGTASAEEAFLALHPGWEVKAADRPDDANGAVRLVVWSSAHGIGRIVMMEPTGYGSGWEERPLIASSTVGEHGEEALLEAFSGSYADLHWSYLSEALPVDLEGPQQSWTLSYYVWDGDTGEWTDLLETDATRDVDTGAWSIEPPEGLTGGSDDGSAVEESSTAE